jgi:hypothetical protein
MSSCVHVLVCPEIILVFHRQHNWKITASLSRGQGALLKWKRTCLPSVNSSSKFWHQNCRSECEWPNESTFWTNCTGDKDLSWQYSGTGGKGISTFRYLSYLFFFLWYPGPHSKILYQNQSTMAGVGQEQYPSYSGNRVQDDHGWREVQVNNSQNPILEIPNRKQGCRFCSRGRAPA